MQILDPELVLDSLITIDRAERGPGEEGTGPVVSGRGAGRLRSDSSSGFKGGTSKSNGRFWAQAAVGKTNNNLGTFDTAEEAALAVARFLGHVRQPQLPQLLLEDDLLLLRVAGDGLLADSAREIVVPVALQGPAGGQMQDVGQLVPRRGVAAGPTRT